MKTVTTIISLVVIFAVFGALGAVGYLAATSEAPSSTDYRSVSGGPAPSSDRDAVVDPSQWRTVYPDTKPMQLGTTTIHVSIADSLRERIRGLSDTPFLPDDVVKLFVFYQNGSHSIWMKDMNYSLDIIWLSKAGEVVHIEPNRSPETFPKTFESPTPAWFVLEAAAGFVERHELAVGDTLDLPATDAASVTPHTLP